MQGKEYEETLVGILLITLLAAVATWLAFSQPLLKTVERSLPIEHEVALTYSAEFSGNVYDRNVVQPGEPIFRQLSDRLTVGFTYRLLAENSTAVGGQYNLVAELRDVNGWKRTIRLVEPTTFEGNEVTAAAELRFADIQAIIDQLQSTTGLARSSYLLAVRPRITVSGLVAGTGFNETVMPEWVFALDSLQLQLAEGPGLEDGTLTGSTASGVALSEQVDNTVAIVTLDVPVRVLRPIAAGILALCLLGLLWQALMALRLRRMDATERLRRAHKDKIVEVDADNMPAGVAQIRLHTFADLLRMAEQTGQVIMQSKHGTSGALRYLLQTAQAVYLYEPDGGSQPVTTLEAADARPAIVDPVQRALVDMFANLPAADADRELARTVDRLLAGLATAIDLQTHQTIGRTQRLADMVVELALAHGVAPAALDNIWRGALLHDIGLLQVPDLLLLQPREQLMPDELQQVDMHPRYAYDLLSQIAPLVPAVDIPAYHHERWDGNGYPFGLAGEQIPLAARLFAVVALWDTLVRSGTGGRIWSQEAARQFIAEQAGKRFDPAVVQTFLTHAVA